jgi:hypothetical protein
MAVAYGHPSASPRDAHHACMLGRRNGPDRTVNILGLNREDFGGLRVGCTHKPPERHGDLPALRLAVAGSNEPIGVDNEPAGMQLAEGGERGVAPLHLTNFLI